MCRARDIDIAVYTSEHPLNVHRPDRFWPSAHKG